jgi:hypothetical protein
MRVRITKPLSGSIDGIQLGRFITGLTYDVGTTLANYLLAEGLAVPAELQTPGLVLPIPDAADTLFSGHQIAEAADRIPRHKRTRVRKKR